MVECDVGNVFAIITTAVRGYLGMTGFIRVSLFGRSFNLYTKKLYFLIESKKTIVCHDWNTTNINMPSEYSCSCKCLIMSEYTKIILGHGFKLRL